MTPFFKNQILISIALGTTLVLTGCSNADQTESGATAEASWSVAHVDAKGASALLMSQPETIILDIRTPEEVEEGYIDGAVFADFSQADFEAQLTKLDPSAAYIVHCRSGGRSTKALTTLEKLGFTNITHMDGGIKGWTQAKLPLVTP